MIDERFRRAEENMNRIADVLACGVRKYHGEMVPLTDKQIETRRIELRNRIAALRGIDVTYVAWEDVDEMISARKSPGQ